MQGWQPDLEWRTHVIMFLSHCSWDQEVPISTFSYFTSPNTTICDFTDYTSLKLNPPQIVLLNCSGCYNRVPTIAQLEWTESSQHWKGWKVQDQSGSVSVLGKGSHPTLLKGTHLHVTSRHKGKKASEFPGDSHSCVCVYMCSCVYIYTCVQCMCTCMWTDVDAKG